MSRRFISFVNFGPAWQARRVLPVAAAILLVLQVAVYRDTFLSMAMKWLDDAAFNYGFVVAPISIWLAWGRRSWLRQLEFRPCWPGLVALLCAAVLWVVARGTGVLVVEQIAVVAMIPSILLAVLGRSVCRALLFPLLYLFFMVPIGRAIVPWLAQITADMATWALQVTGIPVYRSHQHIMIPGGWFEVAKACSGVAFLMTGLALGVLYAHLNYTSWRKRLAAIVVAMTVPILANGVRVYITILISYLTDMRWGAGHEHVVYGQVLFILVLLGTFWIGVRWHDDRPGEPAWLSRVARRSQAVLPTGPGGWLVVTLAMLVMLAAPAYQSAFASQLRETVPEAASSIRLPAAQAPWQGPVTDASDWRPLFRNGLAELHGSYRNATGGRVDAFVAVYGLGATGGAEMISYQNVLYAEEKNSVPNASKQRLDFGAGRTLEVREVVVPDGGAGRLVWHWYVVGGRAATNPFVVKALEAAAWVFRSAHAERVVTLATTFDDGAHERLRQYVAAHADCVASGFAAKDCGG